MADSTQKRGTQRVDVTLKVQLQYPDRDTFVERFSINVSRTGLFIRARDPAPVGSRVRFEYRLTDESRVLRGTGVVRWVRSDASDPTNPPGMGIEFIDLDPASEQLVTHIVATKGEGERAPKRTGGIARKAPATSVVAKAEPVAAPQLDAEEEDLLAGLAEGAAPKKKAAPPPPPPPPQAPPPPADEIRVDARDSGPDPDAPHVIFDLAGPALLATLSQPNEGAPPDRFDERKLDLTLGLSSGALQLGGPGVAVPGLFAWADSVMRPATRIMAQKLGLALKIDANGRPAVTIDESDIALIDVALAAARHTLGAYAEQASVAPRFRVIVPASADSSLITELRALVGPASTRLEIVDDLAVLGGRHSQGLVVAITHIETRVGRVVDGKTVAHVALRDSGIIDADDLIVQITGRALVKEHGIDVEDDPSLRIALQKQVELGRKAGDDSFDVSIAGATIAVDTRLIERALFPIAARIALAIDELDGAAIPIIVAADDMVWPGLVAQIDRLLGRDIEQVPASTWLRMG